MMDDYNDEDVIEVRDALAAVRAKATGAGR